ncbi:tight adherence protein C [Nakamurella panacisegetis]|uniref:Tight adherence protein C n=1 Tax=Nakamurella panacisegetis TaxID=1090615 RepID=A0A1H0HNM6_9ACTN|nr:type II secretion system F family protein [Nakamurella panacisegetis]SDO20785.1 tight adherence protein C [Nakamurella panacisegetis]
MAPIVLAAALTFALGVGIASWVVLTPADPAREEVLANAIGGLRPADGAAGSTPRRNPSGGLARHLTGGKAVARLERLSALAGRPPAWTLGRLMGARLILPAVGAALSALFVEAGPSTGRYLLAVLVTVVAHFLPDLLLYSRGQERQAAMGLELADTLDQMTIAVEAGLGFEGAMLRAAKNGRGPLAEELIRTLQDMQLGQSRREAYLALANRTSVPDLRRFLRAVIQADLYGIAIAGVLRTQAHEMRMKRRQAAEEKAMKIPVKVIFPLMLCILPALFIVLLGPVAIEMAKNFK